MAEIKETITYKRLLCAACDIPMFMTAEFEKRRRDDHQTFFCISGHRNFFDAESETERLRKRVHAMEINDAQRTKTIGTLYDRVNKAESDRKVLIERVHNGVCPCCNRTFKQLARHMSIKHPDYKP